MIDSTEDGSFESARKFTPEQLLGYLKNWAPKPRCGIRARPALFNGPALMRSVMTLYDDVMRTIIELPHDQLLGLDVLCGREQISRAEAIRQAVAEHLKRNQPPDTSRAYGLWKGRRLDGVTHQRALRREWAR